MRARAQGASAPGAQQAYSRDMPSAPVDLAARSRRPAAVGALVAALTFAVLYEVDLDVAAPAIGVASWAVSYAVEAVRGWGWIAVLVLMALESSSLPVPSEVVLPLAGFLVHEGSMDPYAAFAAALAGSLAGSYADYYIGYAFGVGVLRRLPWISGEALARAESWFRAYGEPMVLYTRMIPGVRTLISFPAGALGMSPLRFGAYTAAGSALWDAVLMASGYALASRWEMASAAAQEALLPALAAAGAGLLTYLALARLARRGSAPGP